MRSAPIRCPVCQVVGPIIDEDGCCATCGADTVPVPAMLTAEELDDLEALARRAQKRAGGVVALAPAEAQRLLAAARQLPAASEEAERQALLEKAAKLLRNHIAGENVDDLMHYWADEWDHTEGYP